ncbi:hypothetical protein [Streptomyces coelicoflavus]|nr:hypothetical protein [Streptomyces coelicoflavus]
MSLPVRACRRPGGSIGEVAARTARAEEFAATLADRIESATAP